MAADVMPIAVAEPLRSRIASPWLRAAFVFAVIGFAWLRFSDNRADNDLWGHVLYGERMLALGHVEKTDALSWTAAGQPWINHEIGAELALALAHRAAGGFGLWLLMVVMAVVTVGWACIAGTRQRAHVATTLTLLAVSTNFIASGYAPRPQLFTMLAMVALIVLLRRGFAEGARGLEHAAARHANLEGRRIGDNPPYLKAPLWDARPANARATWILPLLFAAWVNVHGGFLAGWLILVMALGTELIVSRRRQRAARVSPAVAITLIIACTAALGLNPDGFRLVTWTVETVQLPRPTITEWQPMAFGFATLPFYAVLVGSALAWSFTTRRREAWAAVTLVVLGGMSVLQQRHAPLFGLANLILTPEHLESVGSRVSSRLRGLMDLLRRRAMQTAATFVMIAAGAVSIVASVAPPREHPFTIEVPRDTYPVAAIAFIRDHKLTGNTLTFFDWGEQVLWELPYNPVSFDGRLDTVYPPAVMDAHWRFYRGQPPGAALDLSRADVALLPSDSPATMVLVRAGWKVVYRDPLADVLIPASSGRAASFPRVFADGSAIGGRQRFPDGLPALASAGRER